MYKLTRGIRNKNPGNIRDSIYNNWNGKTGVDGAGFVIFSDARFGIRAIGKTIDSYQRRSVLTIAQIIETWAPPSENNTASYIQSVAARMATSPDYIPSRSKGDYLPLVKAIITHENGFNPYSDDEINQGLNA